MDDAIAPDTLALHHALLTVDTHINIPWPTGPDPLEDDPRCVDLPKMRRGDVSAGCFAVYMPQIQRTPIAEDAVYERAINTLRAIGQMGQGSDGQSARSREQPTRWRQ